MKRLKDLKRKGGAPAAEQDDSPSDGDSELDALFKDLEDDDAELNLASGGDPGGDDLPDLGGDDDLLAGGGGGGFGGAAAMGASGEDVDELKSSIRKIEVMMESMKGDFGKMGDRQGTAEKNIEDLLMIYELVAKQFNPFASTGDGDDTDGLSEGATETGAADPLFAAGKAVQDEGSADSTDGSAATDEAEDGAAEGSEPGSKTGTKTGTADERTDAFGDPLPGGVDRYGRPLPVAMDEQGRPILAAVDEYGRPLPGGFDEFGRPLSDVADEYGRPMPGGFNEYAGSHPGAIGGYDGSHSGVMGGYGGSHPEPDDVRFDGNRIGQDGIEYDRFGRPVRFPMPGAMERRSGLPRIEIEGRWKVRPILSRINNDYASVVLALRWIEFLFERVKRNNISSLLDYYEDIGWISNEVKSNVMAYARGAVQDISAYDPELEEESFDNLPMSRENQVLDDKGKVAHRKFRRIDEWKLSAEDHLKSLLFIKKMGGARIDKDELNSLEQEVKVMKYSLRRFHEV